MPRAATSVATSVSTCAGLETGQGALALALGLVAVHGHGVEAPSAEPLDQPVGAALGADEDEGEVTLLTELGDQRLDPLAVNGHEAVLDLLGGTPGGRAVLVQGRIVGVRPGDPPGLAVQRGREEQGLALGRAGGDDPVHGGAEAHVEHPVGLVEDERVDVAQVEGTARQLVLEPSRGGDDDVAASGVSALIDQADPAVDGGDAQRAGVGDPAQVSGDLGGQLAGGGEDQRGRTGSVGRDPVDQRDTEGEGLARARGRAGEHIAPGEDVGEDQRLDGERLGDVLGGESAYDSAGHAQIGE